MEKQEYIESVKVELDQLIGLESAEIYEIEMDDIFLKGKQKKRVFSQ